MLTSPLIALALATSTAHAGTASLIVLNVLLEEAPTSAILLRDEGAVQLVRRVLPETARVIVLQPTEDPMEALSWRGRSGCAVLVTRVGAEWDLMMTSSCPSLPASGALMLPPAQAQPLPTEGWQAEEEIDLPVVVAAAPSPEVAAAPPSQVIVPPAAPLREQVERPTRKPRSEQAAHGLTIAYGGMYGAYAGGMGAWLVGEALEESEEAHRAQGVAPGALVGSVTGATAAHFLSKSSHASPRAAGLLYTSTGVGWYYGEQLGRMLIGPDAPGATERIRASGLAGSMAGIGIGIAKGDKAAPLGHQAHFVMATGIGWVAGHGIGDLARLDRQEDRRARGGIETGMSLCLGAASLAFNHSGKEGPKPGTIALSMADGAWFGGWAPFLFDDAPTSQQAWGGAELGTGLGYATAITMAVAGQPSPASAGLQAIGLAAGSSLGAGIPLLTGEEGKTRAVVGPMLLGGAAGQVLGAAVAPHYKIEPNDRLLLTTLESWTAYQAVGWSVFARQTGATNAQSVGYALTAGGAGTLASMALIPALDVSPEGSVMLLSGGAWGTWFGAWGSQMAHGDADGLWLASLSAGDGALLATAIGQGIGWKPTWKQTASINGFGLLGAAAGGLLGAIALYDPNDWTPVSASIVAGSGAGLIAGGIIGSMGGHKGKAQSQLLAPIDHLTAKLPFDTQIQALPWSDEGGSPGVWLQVDLSERARDL